MPLDWSPLVAWLRRYERPLLMTHIRPDADGLGSQLALQEALTAIGQQPRVAIASKLPPRYTFLDPHRQWIEDFHPTLFSDRDCVLILDTGTWNQLGDFGQWLQASSLPRAVVDHHRTQDDLGGLRLVDTTAEATGRLAYEIITALGLPLSPRMAQHLFMAVATDTGWFRHANTTPATFALCGELVARGANPTVLYEQLYESATLARLKLTALALERLQVVADGKIAYTEIRLADYAATGAVPGDTEDLINYPRGIDGVAIAVLFIEQPDGGTKVSWRSRAVDVSQLAERWGGGGHKLASGARVLQPLDQVRPEVLNATAALLRGDWTCAGERG
ncbi:MAG: bifunctional oligoribonuclease/PAP phosphatase NrnA [Gemmataceae bacterium]|nr:bifunctional oligoribonuclease/PAP phosphatase NrnA [Gemmata sp.]MDW8199523.1 bifunctional oligoribonuclease/PAP phosphatase NrnA [Gemmataceae bacterium]